jgi:hypothetical protein
MESNGNSKSRLVTAGGILSIVGGRPQIISGAGFIAFYLNNPNSFFQDYRLHNYVFPTDNRIMDAFFLPFFPDLWKFYIERGFGPNIVDYIMFAESNWPILAGCLVVVGIVAVIGGISAIRRKRFGLSLAGAICALPSVHLGILAVIFTAVGKREFGASEVD